MYSESNCEHFEDFETLRDMMHDWIIFMRFALTYALSKHFDKSQEHWLRGGLDELKVNDIFESKNHFW